MTQEETKDIIEMVRAATRTPVMDGGEYVWWMEQLRGLDIALATKTVFIGASLWKKFPTWAGFFEIYKEQRKLHDPERITQMPDLPPGKVPFWIKRYCCARYLYTKFGREQDMRVFAEQKDGWMLLRSFHGGADQSGYPHVKKSEVMPSEEWTAEAEQISDDEVWRAFQAAT